MKKTALIAAAAMTLMLMTAARPANDVITKDGKTTIVNTTTLTKKVRGFSQLGGCPRWYCDSFYGWG